MRRSIAALGLGAPWIIGALVLAEQPIMPALLTAAAASVPLGWLAFPAVSNTRRSSIGTVVAGAGGTALVAAAASLAIAGANHPEQADLLWGALAIVLDTMVLVFPAAGIWALWALIVRRLS